LFVVPATWIPTISTITFTCLGYTVTALIVARRLRAMA